MLMQDQDREWNMRGALRTALDMTVAVAFLITIQWANFGLLYSSVFPGAGREVDEATCVNSCWDTVFKGSYYNPPPSVQYKHVYFNVTPVTLKIWGITVLAILLTYEAVKRVLELGITGQLRFSMLVALIAVIHPNYYGWWTYFGYFNDSHFGYVYHQMMYCFTELACSVLIVSLLDRSVSPAPRALLAIVVICVVHILGASLDNFISNVIQGHGSLAQVARDNTLLISDVIQIAAAGYELRKLSFLAPLPRRHMVFAVLIGAFLMLILRVILPNS